jgi:hypothetical protein
VLSHSLTVPGHNPLPANTSGDGDAPHVPQHVPAGPPDPALTRIVEAWPTLADHIKAAILTLAAGR